MSVDYTQNSLFWKTMLSFASSKYWELSFNVGCFSFQGNFRTSNGRFFFFKPCILQKENHFFPFNQIFTWSANRIQSGWFFFALFQVDLLVEIMKLVDREEKRTIKEEKVGVCLIFKFNKSLWVIGSWQTPCFQVSLAMVEPGSDLHHTPVTGRPCPESVWDLSPSRDQRDYMSTELPKAVFALLQFLLSLLPGGHSARPPCILSSHAGWSKY